MSETDHIKAGYHDLCRRELLDLIPITAKSIFDLGCGTGTLGAALKERQSCHVSGIELNSEAAKAAKDKIDIVYSDNLNRFDPLLSKKRYDCLILGDILEHLIAPWAVLKKFVSVLSDDGTVIASIPNVAHPFVIDQLQRGLFRYEQAGLLDVTHLRFFTKTTIFQLFVKCGLKITKFDPYPSKENPVQFHVTAVKPKHQYAAPLVTILILTYNGLAYTRECIKSIVEKTRLPYKILVIDNASTDGTVAGLRADTRIQHIENSVNHGFARGFNIGLECVDTPYFVIANNDIIVTDGWLTQLKANIDRDDKLLVLGTRSNAVSGPQAVKAAPYTSQRGLDDYAASFMLTPNRPITYHPRIVFFCVLLKSLALRKIGLFDEIFGIGNFEDDDYCVRAQVAGYKTAFDNTVFIHHAGSQTFRDSGIDYAKLMEKNKQLFLAKWKIKGAK